MRGGEIPYFDAHCDTVFAAARKGETLRRNSLHVDLERLSRYSPCAQVFAIWSRALPPRRDGAEYTAAAKPAPYQAYRRRYRELLCTLKRGLEENSDLAVLCLTAEDIKSARARGKTAAVIAVEGAEHLRCSERCLKAAYDDGVRLVNLTWNYDNALAGSAMDSGAGLTAKGRSFVKAAQTLGVTVDLSHTSEAAFWAVCEMAEKPVFAGHSCSAALHMHPRNLSDAQFMAIVKTSGFTGINLYPDFLGLSRDIDAVTAHIERFLSLGGEKTVGLGGDLDGLDELAGGINGVEDMPLLYEALLRRGYAEDLVRDIFYNNLLAALERSWAGH